MIIDLYRSVMHDKQLKDHSRITKTFAHSNPVLTDWEATKLVGICRSLTDFGYGRPVWDLP